MSRAEAGPVAAVSALSAKPRRRIGLFGGSFNPPHLAHEALARLALQALALDELRWIPAGQPWQKRSEQLAPAADRAAMVAQRMAGEPRFVLDLREVQRSGPSYTIDTVRELRAEQPGADFFLILGQDQYGRIDLWRDAAQLRPLVCFAVASRNGQPPEPPAAWAGLPVDHVTLPLPEMAVSATDIRARIAAGQPITPLVGQDVARYIEQHRLYRASPGH